MKPYIAPRINRTWTMKQSTAFAESSMLIYIYHKTDKRHYGTAVRRSKNGDMLFSCSSYRAASSIQSPFETQLWETLAQLRFKENESMMRSVIPPLFLHAYHFKLLYGVGVPHGPATFLSRGPHPDPARFQRATTIPADQKKSLPEH